MQITTIGLDLAKSVFQVHAVDAKDTLSSAKRCGGHRFCRSLPSFPPASSAWKLAAPRIIGHAS